MAAASVNALAVDLSSLEGRFCHGNLKTENLFEVLNFLDAEGRTASTSKSKKKRRKARGGRQRTSSEPSGETLQPQSNVVDDKQKVQYLDKLTNIIAAKAKAEWRNQIRGFELLQKENEKLQMALKEKEKETVTFMIDSQAQSMSSYICNKVMTEDRKSEYMKEINNLDVDIDNLQDKITKMKEEQKALKNKCTECDYVLQNLETEKSNLEKSVEIEMENFKTESEVITREIHKLRESYETNMRDRDDLVRRLDAIHLDPGPWSRPGVRPGCQDRLVEFVMRSISEKEADLECPVCLETAEAPIFMCQEMHLICSVCQPKLTHCPECRQSYLRASRRHRFAEKNAEDLQKLRQELTQIT